jgi:hypothetical protein
MKFLEALSQQGERKLTSSLARVREDQRRLLKMWLSNQEFTWKQFFEITEDLFFQEKFHCETRAAYAAQLVPAVVRRN